MHLPLTREIQRPIKADCFRLRTIIWLNVIQHHFCSRLFGKHNIYDVSIGTHQAQETNRTRDVRHQLLKFVSFKIIRISSALHHGNEPMTLFPRKNILGRVWFAGVSFFVFIFWLRNIVLGCSYWGGSIEQK